MRRAALALLLPAMAFVVLIAVLLWLAHGRPWWEGGPVKADVKYDLSF